MLVDWKRCCEEGCLATNADLDLVEKELKKHDLEQEDLSNYIEMMRAIMRKIRIKFILCIGKFTRT